jgi:hypothetical protein
MTLTKLICCTLLIGYLPCLVWSMHYAPAGAALWEVFIVAYGLDCMLVIPAIGVWLMFQ